MTLSIGKLPPSSLGIDTSGAFTAADARAAFAMGKRFFLGCIGLPDVSEDCSAERISSACAEGLAVGLYGFYRSGSWSADTGAFDARLHIDRTPKNVPDGGLVCCDLELPGGPPPSPDALLAYLRAYLAIRRTDPRKLAAGLYVGRVPLSAAQIAALGFDVLYHSGMDGTPEGAGLVYHLEQLRAIPGKTMNVRLPGVSVPVDLDVLHSGDVPWIVDPSVFREDGAPSTEPPPAVGPRSSDDDFTFAQRDGEAVGDRRARCLEELCVDGPVGHRALVKGQWQTHPRAHRYASFQNVSKPAGTIGGQPCADISAWSTSCLITQEAVDHWCGGTNPPPRNGAGFYEVYPAAKLKKPDGGNSLPKRGDITYVANTGTDGHVACILRRNPDGSWLVAAGGGGDDGTQVSIYTMAADAHGYPHDHRGCQGWWSAEDLELPPSAPVTRPDLPGLISSADEEERGTLPSQPSPAPATPAAKPPDQARPPTPAPPAAPAKPAPALPPPKRPIAAPAVSVGAIFTAAGAVLAWAQAHPWLAGGGVALAAFAALVVWDLHHRAQARAHEAAANAKRTDDLKAIHDRLDEQEKTMSQISDQLAQVQASLTAAQGSLTTVSSEVQALDAEIQKLQAQLNSGSSQLDPADASALAALVTQSAAVATAASAAAQAAAPPAAPPPPAPAAEPAK